MDLKNIGGTPGGTRHFILGMAMTIAGAYLLLHQVIVTGGYWQLGLGGGARAFGVSLLPLLFGIGLLFQDGRSAAGRILTAGGALVIVTGIIANVDVQMRETSLFNLLVMLVLLVGGVGLVARAVLPVGAGEDDRRRR